MDFTFLPKTILKTRAFTRIATTGNATAPGKDIYIQEGFYYIGGNSSSIDKLVHVFKRGYASQLLDDAKWELERAIAQNKNVVPEIIVCEGNFTAAQVKLFSEFLKGHPALSAVPFIVNQVELGEAALRSYKR